MKALGNEIAARYSADVVVVSELEKYDKALYSIQSATVETMARIHRPLFDEVANGLVFGGATSALTYLVSHRVLDASIAFDSVQLPIASIDNYQKSLFDDFGQDQAYLSAINGIQKYVDSTETLLSISSSHLVPEQMLYGHREVDGKFRKWLKPKHKKKVTKKQLRKKLEKSCEVNESQSKEIAELKENASKNIDIEKALRRIEEQLTKITEQPTSNKILTPIPKPKRVYDWTEVLLEIAKLEFGGMPNFKEMWKILVSESERYEVMPCIGNRGKVEGFTYAGETLPSNFPVSV